MLNHQITIKMTFNHVKSPAIKLTLSHLGHGYFCHRNPNRNSSIFVASPRRQLDMETCASKIRVYTGADGRPSAFVCARCWRCCWMMLNVVRLLGTNSIHIGIWCCMPFVVCCCWFAMYSWIALLFVGILIASSVCHHILCLKRPLFLLLSISAISGWNMFEPVELDLFFPTPIQPYHNLSPLRKCKIFIFAQQEILHSCMC